MKKLFNKPFLFSGVGLYNNTKRYKRFKFYDGSKTIFEFVVEPKGALITSDNLFGVFKFDYPVSVKSLSVDAGRKWAIVVNKNDTNYFSIKSDVKNVCEPT